MRFAIINESSTTISHTDMGAMCGALQIQLNRDFATYWNDSYEVRGLNEGDTGGFMPGEVVVHIDDALPQAPGAIAYHDVDGSALPIVFVAASLCPSILQSSGSLSAAISHELLEAAADPACNRWVDDGNGTLWALEVCDATQGDSYTIEGNGAAVTVSNFVLPSFFNVYGSSPFTFIGASGEDPIAKPFSTASGGYQLYRNADNNIAQVMGHIPVRLALKKNHWSSRTHKRFNSPLLSVAT